MAAVAHQGITCALPTGDCYDQGTGSPDAKDGETLLSGHSEAHLRTNAGVCSDRNQRVHQAHFKEEETQAKNVNIHYFVFCVGIFVLLFTVLLGATYSSLWLKVPQIK